MRLQFVLSIPLSLKAKRNLPSYKLGHLGNINAFLFSIVRDSVQVVTGIFSRLLVSKIQCIVLIKYFKNSASVIDTVLTSISSSMIHNYAEDFLWLSLMHVAKENRRIRH